MKQENYLYGLLNVCISRNTGFYVNVMTDTLGINELESAVMNVYSEAQACYLYSVGILKPEEVEWSVYSDRTETGLYIRNGKSHYDSVEISEWAQTRLSHR